MREAIETAPKNGEFVILEDAAQGTFEVARWSVERGQWVDPDGRPSRLNATHWEFPQTVDELVTPGQLNATDLHQPVPAQGVAATAGRPGSLTGLSESSFRRVYRGDSGVIAAYQRATAAGADPDAIVAVVGEDRDPVIAVAAAGDVAAVGGGADRAEAAAVDDAVAAAAARPASGAGTAQPRRDAEPGRSANVGAGSLGLVGSGQGKIPSAFAIAGGWIVRRQRSIATMAACILVGVAFAILATELVTARREVQSRLSVADTANDQAAGEQRRALQLERDKVEKLTADLAEARSRLEVQAKANAAVLKEAADRSAEEQRRALQLERDKAEKLTAEFAEARSRLEAQAKANAAAAKEAADRSADGQRRALQLERDKTEKLTAALAEAKSSLEAQAKANVAAVKEVADRSADEQRRALQQERDKIEKLTADLAEARSRLEAQAKAQAAGVKEVADRSADEQRRVLQQERDKVEKLTAELADARSRLEAQAKAKAADDGARDDQLGTLRKELQKARADAAVALELLEAEHARREQIERRLTTIQEATKDQGASLQQERDKVAKLTADLAEARSRLEAQTTALAADDVARNKFLATLRGELEKARADAAAARELLEAERTRRERIEQRLTTIQAATRDDGGRAPAPAAPTVGQPSAAAPSVAPAQTSAPTADAAPPANAPTRSDARVEPGNPQAVRLIARASLLLEQGNIGAARNMLDQAAAMGSAEALFWLAATYDPLLLSARNTVGTQSDIAKARELYTKALAGGVTEARLRLEALQR